MADYILSEDESFDLTDDADTSVTGASGGEYINVYLQDGANLTIDAGDGDDSVYANTSATYVPGEYVYDEESQFGYWTGSYEGGDFTISGGAGNDYIQADAYGGYGSVDAGAGDDFVSVSAADGFAVSGGAGNDTLNVSLDSYLSNSGFGHLDAGDGDDVITTNGSGSLTMNLTGGSGSDSYIINASSSVTTVITDFEAGDGGDVVVMTNILNRWGGFDGTNPFASGHLILEQRGLDCVLVLSEYLDPLTQIDLITFENTTATDFSAANFGPGFAPDGAPLVGQTITGTSASEELVAGMGGDTIFGLEGDDSIVGGFGDDVMYGGLGNDNFTSGGGNDTYFGGEGDDSVISFGGQDISVAFYGGDGDDNVSLDVVQGTGVVEGGEGEDSLYLNANNGTLTVSGNAGSDYISVYGQGGSATVDGGDGNDSISVSLDEYYEYGEDIYDEDGFWIGQEPDTEIAAEISINGGAGSDQIYASGYGSTGTVDGGEDDDRISFSARNNVTVTGGAGQDRFYVQGINTNQDNLAVITDFTAGPEGDSIDLSSILYTLDDNYDYEMGAQEFFDNGLLSLNQNGADTQIIFQNNDAESYVLLTLQGVNVSDLMEDGVLLNGSIGPAASIEIYGDETDEMLSGGAGNDIIYGEDGDDVISGFAGDDQLYAGAGHDTVYGGSGHDNISDSDGSGLLDGGAGSDTIEYYGGNIESGLTILGDAGDDNITASLSSGAVLVDGGDGDDAIYVYQNNYYYYYSGSDSDSEVSVTGGQGNDRIQVNTGDASINVDAGDGNDFVNGSLNGGADQSATIDLGAGEDRLSLDLGLGATTITTGEGQDYIELRGGDVSQDTGVEFTDFTAGLDGDILDISYMLGRLPGYLGGNPFAAGNLVLEQRGADAVLMVLGQDGETYFDRIIFRDTNVEDFVDTNFFPELPLDGSAIPVETIMGTDGSDYLIGNLGVDIIFGLDGDDNISGRFDADTIYGGDGNDVIYGDATSIDGGDGNDYIATSAMSVTVTGGAGDDQINVRNYSYYSDDSPDLTVTTASVDSGIGNDQISYTSNSASNVIDAGDGDDYVTVNQYGQNVETLDIDLGAGNDNLTIDSSADVITITTGDGQDVIRFNNYFAYENSGIVITDFAAGASGDTLELTNLLDSLQDWDGDNPFGSGNLVLEQRGTDTVLVMVDIQSGDRFDAITFSNTLATDFIDENFEPTLALDGTPIPTETILGTAGSDGLYGNLGIDIIYGLEGEDYLRGEFGADSLYGGAGEDTLDGSKNGGLLDGGDDADEIRVYGGQGDYQISGGEGGDNIYVTLEGDLLIDGGDGDDQINAYNSAQYYYDDTISNDETSVSVINGGAGNDRINFELGGATVNISAGDGDDTVSGGLVVVDNATIDLGSGDDSLEIWTTGESLTITTGAGEDTIHVRAFGPNQEAGYIITDFTAGADGDRLELEDLLNNLGDWDGNNPFGDGQMVLEQRGADTVLSVKSAYGAEYFDAVTFLNTTATDLTSFNFGPYIALDGAPIADETVFGTAGDDYLEGDLGTDVILGYAGDDEIVGLFGPDILYGGGGSDGLTASSQGGSLYGGAGHDELESYGSTGPVAAYGGIGNDSIIIESRDDILVDAGDGDDYVSVEAYHGYNFELGLFENSDAIVEVGTGAGNDTIEIASNPLAHLDTGSGDDVIMVKTWSNVEIATGSGLDHIRLEFSEYFAEGNVVITDFIAGVGGDVIEIPGQYEEDDFVDWSERADEFTLVQNGANTEIVFTGENGNIVLATLNNVNATDLTDENFQTMPVPEISEINRGPVLVTALNDAAVDEDSGAITLQIGNDAFSDLDGDALTYTASLANGASLPTWLTFNASTLQFTGTAPLNYNGVLSLRVVASDGEFDVSDTFSLTINPVNDQPAGTVTVSGDLVDGETLSAASNVTDADGIATSGFVWKRDGVVISGATAASYVLTQADVGTQISVDFVYTDGFGNLHQVSSAQTAAVADDVTVDPVDPVGPIGTPDSDTLVGGTGEDSISGGGGDDVIAGGNGADDLTGGAGADQIDGGFGADSISGGSGADAISGGGGADTLFGNKGHDLISGGGKGDLIYGGSGKDVISGGKGKDVIYGGGGKDELYGNGGKDMIYGDKGKDALFGGNGKDELFGGSGADKIEGGGGRDEMTGGTGADDFIFDDGDSSTANSKRDVITDFGTGADDIDLRLMDADTGTNSDDAFVFSGTTAGAHSVWYEVDGSNVVVYGDQTGDGNADFEIELLDVSSLTASDFLL